jgi:putative colanic acid biosynthesis acetyltransferase WcaF
LLRAFGASIDDLGKVVVFPSARIAYPKNLELEDRAMIGPRVEIYNLGKITLRYGANVSQNCHLCAGTHDFNRWDMPLVTAPITLEPNVWLAADVFVGPGVTIGELSVVGARSVVMRDLPPSHICVGTPCRPIKPREDPTTPDSS